jgi:ABC-type transport system involved in multi-copper enzyme maturation permease subunit
MKFMAIVFLTFRESFAKKTFVGFLAISSIVLLLFIFALNLDIVDGAQSAVSIFGIQAPDIVELETVILGVQSAVAVMLFTGGIFMSLFATSNLIPTLLQPGFIDLFISKPVSRLQILSGRFLGAIAIVAFNIIYLITGTWLIISLKTGIWSMGLLLAGVMIIITFIILYTLMTFLGLITKSGPFALMFTYLIIFISPLLLQRDHIYALLSSSIYGNIIDAFYYLLPKTAELGAITQHLVSGIAVYNWMPLWSSLLFAVVIYAASSVIFIKKNF